MMFLYPQKRKTWTSRIHAILQFRCNRVHQFENFKRKMIQKNKIKSKKKHFRQKGLAQNCKGHGGEQEELKPNAQSNTIIGYHHVLLHAKSSSACSYSKTTQKHLESSESSSKGVTESNKIRIAPSLYHSVNWDYGMDKPKHPITVSAAQELKESPLITRASYSWKSS